MYPRPRSAVISSPFAEQGGELGVCVVDMSMTQRSAADSLFTESASELFAEFGVRVS